MIRYFTKRLILMLPTVFFISLLTFIISTNTPGDPVKMLLSKNDGLSKPVNTKAYTQLKQRLGLDKPLFYFSIKPSFLPESLITKNQEFENQLHNLALFTRSSESTTLIFELIKNQNLLVNYDLSKGTVAEFLQLCKSNLTKEKYRQLSRLMVPGKFTTGILPVFAFNGTQNQYHFWISNFLKGNWGTSYTDKRPVKELIVIPLLFTIGFSLFSVLLAYLISIPLGLYLAANADKRRAKIISVLLDTFYSLPNFWMAIILIFYFSGGDYFNWFPAFGIGDFTEEMTYWEKITIIIPHLVLPVFCWSYGLITIIARQMKGAIFTNLSLDYIRTAKAKGLSHYKVITKHAFKNSLLPILAQFAHLLPAVISGAYIIEYIFALPGIGKISYESLLSRNYPVIYAVMFLLSIITIFANFFADVLVYATDPRISAEKRQL